MSPGLLRAREQFRVRNALTGIALFSLAVGIWAYSLRAVKQEAFDDVDAEALARDSSRPTIEDEKAEKEERSRQKREDRSVARLENATPQATSTPSSLPRGLLATHLSQDSWLLEPSHRTLVWGAPSVDHIGRVSDGRITSSQTHS